MTKDELARTIATFTGGTRKQSRKAVDSIFGRITREIRQDGRSRMVGLGEFRVLTKGERRCYHPPSGEMRILPERQTIRYTPSPGLLRSVQKQQQPAQTS